MDSDVEPLFVKVRVPDRGRHLNLDVKTRSLQMPEARNQPACGERWHRKDLDQWPLSRAGDTHGGLVQFIKHPLHRLKVQLTSV